MPGNPGLREEVKQCIASSAGAGFSKFLAVSSSRQQQVKCWRIFPSAALARRAAIPAKRAGEAAGEREPHSSQTPVADAVQTHLTVLRRFFHQSWTAPCLCSLPSAYSSPCAIMDGLPQLHLLSFCSLLIVDPLISSMQNYPSACTWQPKLAFNIIPFSDLVYRKCLWALGAAQVWRQQMTAGAGKNFLGWLCLWSQGIR